MSGSAQKDLPELDWQVADAQTRILLKLVFDIWGVLEKHNQLSASMDPLSMDPTNIDPPISDHSSQTGPSGLTVREDVLNNKTGTSHLLMLAVTLVLLSSAQVSSAQSIISALIASQSTKGQSINEQKKAVVFIFGTIHPLNPDRTAIIDSNGNRVAVDLPLGTGFFVSYPDWRRGPEYEVSYLVTAKHVLQDTDGAFLHSVSIRLNLKSPAGDAEVDFIRDIPVAGEQGALHWFHSDDPADDVAVLPLSPDGNRFEFTTISTQMFLQDQALNAGTVAEGDALYFIGLMEQYYGVKRNHPLVRRGTLALLTDESIDTPTGRQRVFIAELESWPGNSGSPVFLLGDRREESSGDGRNVSFAGMIIASFLNQFSIPLNGVQPARQLEAGDKANIGMTCIVPAATIQKILDSEPAQRDRDTRIWGRQDSTREALNSPTAVQLGTIVPVPEQKSTEIHGRVTNVTDRYFPWLI